ncbi:hypothetical protein ASG84_12715 [Rhodococcus sp. Leaf278]|uniref:SGNH/GDSL hydrolase family protein n=1 Tax=Rhodococcus sp. Leaf278 TaxID=1736319 RepID=UPI000708DABD|nr:GDSL-type esterase/lipase family protein [Rhodococcus sp. Leaf278]KQU44180.1 hypothetical protein ASG84_12715 [Rhodococcus sp. Leaf278]
MDPATIGEALRQSRADSRKRSRDQRPSGTVGQRIIGGRMGLYNNLTPATFHVACELQAPYEAVQIIFANSKPAYSDNAVSIKVTTLATAADLNGSANTWTQVTKSGLLRMALPIAPATGRLSYALSDIIPLSSIPRTDGGSKPLLAIRAYMGASGDLPVLGNGTDDLTNWATKAGRRWVMRQMTGDGVTDPSVFTSTTNVSQSPIIGVRYWSRGRVVNVMVIGDSLSDGRGTYIGEGFGGLVADRLTSDALAVEYSNCGWSGQATSQFGERAIDVLFSDVKPDVLLFPNSSPNNESTLTDAGFAASDAMYQRVLAACARTGVTPVLWTMIPTDPSIHAWGAADSKRIAANTRALALRDRGVLVADTSTPLSGPVVSGQVGLPAALAPDGIHPGDAGNILMADALTPLVRRAGGL